MNVKIVIMYRYYRIILQRGCILLPALQQCKRAIMATHLHPCLVVTNNFVFANLFGKTTTRIKPILENLHVFQDE